MVLRASCNPAVGKAPAKVLLPGGELREYAPGATAARVLDACKRESSFDYFLCEADAMGPDRALAAAEAGGGEELRPGQTYFALPADMLGSRPGLDVVAALAAKAVRAAGGGGGKAAAVLLTAPEKKWEEKREELAAAMRLVGRERVGRGGRKLWFDSDLRASVQCEEGRRGRSVRFYADLTAIVELEGGC